jgi:hypothetical protein
MDDFDDLWNAMTGGAEYAPGETANNAYNWDNYLGGIYEVDTGTLNPGDPGYGYRYFSDGTAITPSGEYYFGGQKVYDPADQNSIGQLLLDAAKKVPKQALDALKSKLFKPDGGFDPAALGTLATAAYGAFGGGNDIQTGGYNEPVPKQTLVRAQTGIADPNRRPGAGGQQYFTDAQYTPQGDAAAADTARAAAQTQASGLRSAYQPAPAPAAAPAAPTVAPWERNAQSFRQASPAPSAPAAGLPTLPTADQLNEQGGINMAGGGAVPEFKGPLQTGGFVVPGDVVRHADPAGGARKEAGLAALSQGMGAQAIRGPGDAMSDSIPTSIDGKQPAAVANGEAYVPPEKVAEIGGGDMKRGSQRLYELMDRMRMERTGSKEQINPDDPKQLVRAYQGGEIKRFNAGGTTGTPSVTPTSYGTSQASSLSPWAGEYVTGALAQGAAAADEPFQAYQGPLTAGASSLQQQAFSGAQGIAGAGYTPTQFSGGIFDQQQAAQYMNPYLQSALDPQMKEMKRQADISRVGDASRLTQAGAFGGSRQAIMESEGRRNLLDAQSKALGEGYLTAYDKAAAQFGQDRTARMTAEQDTEKSRQFSADYGLKSLADLAKMGEVQRGIEGEGIAADRAMFEQQRDRPMEMARYKLDLLQGLPTGASTTTPNTTGISQLQTQLGDLAALYKSLGGGATGTGSGTTG